MKRYPNPVKFRRNYRGYVLPTNSYEWRITFKSPYYKLQYKTKFLWVEYWKTYSFSPLLEDMEQLYKFRSVLKFGDV